MKIQSLSARRGVHSLGTLSFFCLGVHCGWTSGLYAFFVSHPPNRNRNVYESPAVKNFPERLGVLIRVRIPYSSNMTILNPKADQPYRMRERGLLLQ